MLDPEYLMQEFNTRIAERSMQQDVDEYFEDPWEATYDAIIETVVDLSTMYMALRQIEEVIMEDKNGN